MIFCSSHINSETHREPFGSAVNSAKRAWSLFCDSLYDGMPFDTWQTAHWLQGRDIAWAFTFTFQYRCLEIGMRISPQPPAHSASIWFSLNHRHMPKSLTDCFRISHVHVETLISFWFMCSGACLLCLARKQNKRINTSIIQHNVSKHWLTIYVQIHTHDTSPKSAS